MYASSGSPYANDVRACTTLRPQGTRRAPRGAPNDSSQNKDARHAAGRVRRLPLEFRWVVRCRTWHPRLSFPRTFSPHLRVSVLEGQSYLVEAVDSASRTAFAAREYPGSWLTQALPALSAGHVLTLSWPKASASGARRERLWSAAARLRAVRVRPSRAYEQRSEASCLLL